MPSLSSKRLTRLNLQNLEHLQTLSSTLDFTKQVKPQKEDDARDSPGGRHVISQGPLASPESSLHELSLPKAVQLGLRAYEYLLTKVASPWDSYEKKYDLKLDSFVTVASRKAGSNELVAIKTFGGQDAEDKLHKLRHLRHDHLVALLDIFAFDGSVHVVMEHMPVSLAQVVASPAYPNERQLAAILGQILSGLAYLYSQGFEHGSLTCANVLFGSEGDIKIANQECCQRSNADGRNISGDLRALGYVTMELMQKYIKDDGAIGVENLERWPADSNAVNFLSRTTSASSITELSKHPLISLQWRKEELKWIWELAMISVGRGIKYRE